MSSRKAVMQALLREGRVVIRDDDRLSRPRGPEVVTDWIALQERGLVRIRGRRRRPEGRPLARRLLGEEHELCELAETGWILDGPSVAWAPAATQP